MVIANSEGRQPHWKKLRGLLESAIYGGRVDNLHDFQVCLISLSLFLAALGQLIVCRQSSSVQPHTKAQNQLLRMSGCVCGATPVIKTLSIKTFCMQCYSNDVNRCDRTSLLCAACDDSTSC